MSYSDFDIYCLWEDIKCVREQWISLMDSLSPDMGISCNEQFHPCTTGTSPGLQQVLPLYPVYEIWSHFVLPQDHSPNILTCVLLPFIILAGYLPVFILSSPFFSTIQTVSFSFHPCNYSCNAFFMLSSSSVFLPSLPALLSVGPPHGLLKSRPVGVLLVHQLCCKKVLDLQHKHSVIHVDPLATCHYLHLLKLCHSSSWFLLQSTTRQFSPPLALRINQLQRFICAVLQPKHAVTSLVDTSKSNKFREWIFSMLYTLKVLM